MASPDITLLAVFSNKANYEKYRKMVAKEAITVSETGSILADYEAYFKAFPADESICFDKFRTFVRVIRHSEWKAEKHDAYDAIISRIDSNTSSKSDLSIVDHFNRVDAAGKIIDIANDVAQGKTDDFSPIIEIVNKAKQDAIATDDISHMFGSNDLSAVLESRVRTGGIDWRLDCLNTSAGPLHGGDFVILASRPEAGKTSFICSELTHMVRALPEAKDAVIFNPEEGGGRLFLRLVTAALDEDIISVAANEADAKARYVTEVGRMDRIKVVEPPGGVSTRDIEKVLDRGNFGLVAINVLDKLKHPTKYHQEKEVDRYRSLAYWMRETANRYSVPIIAVVQADAAADGQKYLTMNMLYGSKTGVQGEADLLIGMGMDPTMGDKRFLSLLKNKLPGGLRTNPLLKHAKLEVDFSPPTGRYKDV